MSHPIVIPSGSQSKTVAVPTSKDLESVAIPEGSRGRTGPRGPAGIILVRHGDDATVPRPDTSEIVLWRGSVQPENWDTTQDLWLLE